MHDSKLLRRKLTGAKVLIFDGSGRLLVLKENHKDHWSLPGGITERHESPLQSAIRETKEEIGADVTIERLLCVDYHDGEDREVINFTFLGKLADPEVPLVFADGEVAACSYLPVSEVRALLGVTAAERLDHCLEALEDGAPRYLEAATLPTAWQGSL